ncbi:MAG: hypothetical protein SV775_03805 [Thermodesulfobacteriota bacterium]|nr:hypothetical protein [Thermodesulfobacteriota bacterium]
MGDADFDLKETKRTRLISCLLIIALITPFLGCAAGLTHTQQREMEGYNAKRLAVQEKSPGTATALGFFLGFGSFYTRQYALGLVDFLFWPLSMFWDPVNGNRGAHRINYYATKEYVSAEMEKEIKKLDYDLEDGTITERQYILRKRRIEQKYSVH